MYKWIYVIVVGFWWCIDYIIDYISGRLIFFYNVNIEIWIYIYIFNIFKINLKGEGVNSIIVYIIERLYIVYGRYEVLGWEVLLEIRYRRVNFRWFNYYFLLLDSILNFEKFNKYM